MSVPMERSPFSLERYVQGGQQSPLDRYLLHGPSESLSPNLADILRGKPDGSLLRNMIQEHLRSMNFADMASSPRVNSESLTLSDLIKAEAQKEIFKLVSNGQLRDPQCKCCFRQCPCKMAPAPSSTLSQPGSGQRLQTDSTVTDQKVFEKKHPEHRRFLVRVHISGLTKNICV